MLFLFLDLVSSVRLRFLGVGCFLKFGFLDGQFIVLLGDLRLGDHPGIIGCIVGRSLGNGNIPFRFGFCNGCVLTDLGSVVHTKVLDQSVLIRYILDVTGEDINSQLFHVLGGLDHYLV